MRNGTNEQCLKQANLNKMLILLVHFSYIP